MAFRRLPEADRETFDKIVTALTKRFEPECRKELYITDFKEDEKGEMRTRQLLEILSWFLSSVRRHRPLLMLL